MSTLHLRFLCLARDDLEGDRNLVLDLHGPQASRHGRIPKSVCLNWHWPEAFHWFPSDEPSLAYIPLADWPLQKGIEFFFSDAFRDIVRTLTVALAGYLAEVHLVPEFFPKSQIAFLQKSLFSVEGNFQRNPFIAGASFASSKMPDVPHKIFLDLCGCHGQFAHFFATDAISQLFSFLEFGLKLAMDDPRVRNTISQLAEELVGLQAADNNSKMTGERATEIIRKGVGRSPQVEPPASTDLN